MISDCGLKSCSVCGLTSWMFVDCNGCPAACTGTVIVSAPEGESFVGVDEGDVEEGGVGVTGRLTAVTGMENVVRVTSGLCWTGEVAVCAWFCFSRFLHLARLFWNHT